MNKTETLELLRNELNKAQDNTVKLRQLENIYSEFSGYVGHSMSGKLQDITIDLHNILKMEDQLQEANPGNYRQYEKLKTLNSETIGAYNHTRLTDVYLKNLLEIQKLDGQFKAGELSAQDAAKQAFSIAFFVNQMGKDVTNAQIKGMKKSVMDYCVAFLNDVKAFLPADYKLNPSEINSVVADKNKELQEGKYSDLEYELESNERLLKEAEQYKNDGSMNQHFTNAAEDVLGSFKKLEGVLQSTSSGETFHFDPDEINYTLRGLQDKVSDLYAISNANQRNTNTDFDKWLDDMMSIFHRNTMNTEGALASFQSLKFSEGLPLVSKMLEDLDLSEDRSRFVLNFAESAGTYMYSHMGNLPQSSTMMATARDIVLSSREAVGQWQKAQEVKKQASESVNVEAEKHEDASIQNNEQSESNNVSPEAEEPVQESDDYEKRRAERNAEIDESISKGREESQEYAQKLVDIIAEEKVRREREEQELQEETETEESQEIADEFNDLLSQEDKDILNHYIVDLGKYDWVKHALLHDPNIKISDNLKNILASDKLKEQVNTLCAKQPAFDQVLPFTNKETQEIKYIIDRLYEEGVGKEDIVKRTAWEIKHNGSQSLQDTWQTLSAEFDGSHKYFYLTREYVEKLSGDIFDAREKSEQIAKVNNSEEILNEQSEQKGDDIVENKQHQHDLDKYKRALEVYDIQFVKSQEKPDGQLVIIDRKTGKEVSEGVMSKEEKVSLAKDLTFAKSWVKACGNNLSSAGNKNELGIDARQWEYAFNDGAKETFDQVVQILATNTDKNLDTQKIIDTISNTSTYSYSRSICEALLKKENVTYDWQLKNIHDTLLSHAGLELDKIQINDGESMGR